MKHKVCLFLLLLLQSGIGIAQIKNVYEGDYSFQEKEGTATFEFLENSGEMVMDGFFRFDFLEKDSTDQTILHKFQVTGEYVRNERNGTWIFDRETHRISLEDVVDFEIISSLKSENIHVKAMYTEGVKTGTWTFKQNDYIDGELKPKAEATGIVFSNDKIVKDFDYRNFEGDFTQLIRGEINSEGYMDGEWSLVYLKDSILVSEVRNYENGFLLGVKQRNLETGAAIKEVIFYKTIEKLRNLEAGSQNSFKIASADFGLIYNDGFQSESPQLQIQKPGNRFIDDFISKLMQYDAKNPETTTSGNYPILTKRFEYELYDELDGLLSSLEEKYTLFKDTVETYSEMNALELNKDKSDSLAFTHAYFRSRTKKLEQMKELIELIRTGDIRYVDLNNYTRTGVPFLSPLDLIAYSHRGKQTRKILNHEVGYGNARSFLERVESNLEEEIKLSTDLARYANRELQSIEVNSRLVGIEEEITEKKSLVEAMYESHESASESERQFFENFTGRTFERLFEMRLSDYAETEEPSMKIEKGIQLLDFLNEMETLYPELAAIYPKNEEIDEIYKEETFDPFTYTRYNARAKPRLFEAGMENLFPHYLTEMIREEDYTQIKEHLDKIALLQEKLMALRDTPTKSLERRLGKTKNPEKIASLLDLP
ncbi:hypothetical protein [Cyclobacterium jeungdonense]|uniref:Uncharacterized protein n=1 Tax=Cyclobacterium jeungdonense TaxID=708087 RepID=A0ABT8CC89_9BACT|nr:hypothetical protein [Cyclobacterium jeungdonense]MDN3690430.1 hypothetical protein [Cyclobacterium jeungdonense]